MPINKTMTFIGQSRGPFGIRKLYSAASDYGSPDIVQLGYGFEDNWHLSTAVGSPFATSVRFIQSICYDRDATIAKEIRERLATDGAVRSLKIQGVHVPDAIARLDDTSPAFKLTAAELLSCQLIYTLKLGSGMFWGVYVERDRAPNVSLGRLPPTRLTPLSRFRCSDLARLLSGLSDLIGNNLEPTGTRS
jgi:hypothetical protein